MTVYQKLHQGSDIFSISNSNMSSDDIIADKDNSFVWMSLWQWSPQVHWVCRLWVDDVFSRLFAIPKLLSPWKELRLKNRICVETLLEKLTLQIKARKNWREENQHRLIADVPSRKALNPWLFLWGSQCEYVELYQCEYRAGMKKVSWISLDKYS